MSEGVYHNRVFWITGGGSGIGAAMALEAARRGARVAVSGRRLEKLERVANEIESIGGHAMAVTCDVTEEAQIQDAMEQIIDAWGKLDVVIANAGFGVTGSIEELTAEDWRRQLNTNVVGLAVTAGRALPFLRDVRGRIALVGSVAGVITSPKVGAYSASKAAVRSIGQTLQMELLGSGVSCTIVQPGFVESDINKVDNQNNPHDDWEDRRPQWLMWPADRAARLILDAIWDRERECTFTAHGKLGAAVGQHAPGVVYNLMRGVHLAQKLRGS